jgi:hypothetical protein
MSTINLPNHVNPHLSFLEIRTNLNTGKLLIFEGQKYYFPDL